MERNERELNRRAERGAEDEKRMVGVQAESDRGLSGGLAVGTTLLLAGVAIAFLAFGCGKQGSETVATTASTAETAAPARNASAAAPAVATPKAGVAETTSGTDGTTVQGLRMDTFNGDALPPEVVAAYPEGPVAPGSIIEITANGSSDVVAMTLRDARGKEQPFAYDEAAGVWRALYRAPLKTGAERPALSVTAKNGSERWHRVWVFLNVGQEAARTDSTSN